MSDVLGFLNVHNMSDLLVFLKMRTTSLMYWFF